MATDYITTLQRRTKWKTPECEPRLGMLVVVKHDHSHPAQWYLGRIINLHPGTDGITRVITIKGAHGVVKVCEY